MSVIFNLPWIEFLCFSPFFPPIKVSHKSGWTFSWSDHHLWKAWECSGLSLLKKNIKTRIICCNVFFFLVWSCSSGSFHWTKIIWKDFILIYCVSINPQFWRHDIYIISRPEVFCWVDTVKSNFIWIILIMEDSNLHCVYLYRHKSISYEMNNCEKCCNVFSIETYFDFPEIILSNLSLWLGSRMTVFLQIITW